jgi:hypothetical protein
MRTPAFLMLLPTLMVGAVAAPANITPAWIARFVAQAPTLHTCHGRRPDGVIACANPDCTHYNKASRLIRNLAWSADDPDHWRCQGCGTVFPSADYPEDHTEDVGGLRFAYHLDPAGKRHYFTPIARWAKCYHAMQAARLLGRAAAKGDKVAAAQARDIVLAFAPVYERWIYKFRGGRILYAGFPERCNWGRFGIFADYDWPGILCILYRQLEEAGVMADDDRAAYRSLIECMLENVTLPFSRQIRGLGNPVGQLWYDCVIAARTFPELRVHDLAFEKEFGKERVLTAPDLIHDCIEGRFGVSNLLANYFTSDGLCLERTPAYHAMTTKLLKRPFDVLKGYADPEGYAPLDSNWAPFAHTDLLSTGTTKRVYDILPRLTYPNGHWITLGDAQYLRGDFQPPPESEHHPGWGLSILRRGTGDAKLAALLSTGSSVDGHTHVDHLNLAFFARGHEQVTDIGYAVSGDKIQNTWWRGSAASHNTVIVDGRNQTRSHRGQLVAWADTPHVTLAQHRDPGPYPHLKDYRRTIVLVGDGGDHAPGYLLDVFHVVGGRMHDYLLHAQAPSDESPEAVFSTAGLDITPLDAPRKALELTPDARAGEGYEHIRIAASGSTAGTYEARWQTQSHPRSVLRCIRLPMEEEQVFVGRAPGYRRDKAGIHNSTRQLTKLICRREAAADLASAFVSVIEAHGDVPAIRKARRLEVTGNVGNHPVAVEITTTRGVDVILVARAPGHMTVPAWQIDTDARIAAVSLSQTGHPLAMTLVEGTSLRAGDRRISCEQAAVSGHVIGHPDGLATTPFREVNAGILTDIPAEQLRVGQRLYVDHGGHGHSTYTVTELKAVAPDRPQLTLDRSCRERIGQLAGITEQGRVLVPDTGLPPTNPDTGSCRRFAGMWIRTAGQWHRLRGDLTDAYRLATPIDAVKAAPGQPYVVTRLGPGDTIRIPSVVHLTFPEPE